MYNEFFSNMHKLGKITDSELESYTKKDLNIIEQVSYKVDIPVFDTSQEILHVQDEKSTGVHGGTFVAEGWRTRDLNTIKNNTITNASVNSNQVTLPPGIYWIEGSAPAHGVWNHQARLYDITNSKVLLVGTSEFTSDWSFVTTSSTFYGKVVLEEETVIELQHYSTVTTANTGFGYGSSFDVPCVYSTLTIRRFS